MPEEANIPSNFNVNDYLNFGALPCHEYGTTISPGDEGKIRFNCMHSHLSYDDPIVYPGQQGAAHLHAFFGNPTVKFDTDYQSMRANTQVGTCAGGPINNSAYWYPAMIRPQNNKVVRPSGIILYYNVNRRDLKPFTSPNPAFGTQKAAQNFPRGIKILFGYKMGDPVPTSGPWSCESGSSSRKATIAEVVAAGCPYPHRLVARHSSPNCWDGVNLDSPDHRAHLVYMRQDSYGNNMCPASHPYPVPQVSLLIYFQHNSEADLSQWYISSDRHGGATFPSGGSFHADYWEAWDRPIIELGGAHTMGIGTDGGVGTSKTGNNGQLCTPDGKALDEAHIKRWNTPGSQPESERYLDIPAPGGVEPEPGPEPPVLSTIASLTLVNADTGADIGPLGTTIDLAALPTKNLNVRANTSPAVVTSVSFDLDGVVTTETGSPYAMKGDVSGVYNKWTPSVGAHVLKVTPTNAGVVGTQTIANFTVSDTVVPPIPPEPPVVVYRWQAYKTGKSTLYRFYENNVEVIDALSLTEARWLSGILKITPP